MLVCKETVTQKTGFYYFQCLLPILLHHPSPQTENSTYFMYFFLSRDFCVAVESVALSLGLFILS